MKTIIVSAPIANKPFSGGSSWTKVSYALGFRKLGFDVHFVEKIRSRSGEAPPIIGYFRQIAEQSGLLGNMTLLSAEDHTIEGVPFRDLLDIAQSAALLVNISGHLDVAALTSRIPRRAYVDLDPGFTQFWHSQGSNGFRLPAHDYYFTIGENIGSPDCPVPTGGIHWRRTRQPIVLDDWPVSTDGDPSRFTTVATWRGPFGPINCGDRTLGSKVHEFRKFLEIPARTDAKFEIALSIDAGDHKDREALARHSWRLVDPVQVVPDLHSFRRYIQTSGAEFSVAQGVYAGTQCGWFSDRSVRYLASGKPVLVQETGFRRNLPVGMGLLSFSTLDEAVAGVQSITTRYSEHAAAARRIAEQYFDSDRVLGEMLGEVGIYATAKTRTHNAAQRRG